MAELAVAMVSTVDINAAKKLATSNPSRPAGTISFITIPQTSSVS